MITQIRKIISRIKNKGEFDLLEILLLVVVFASLAVAIIIVVQSGN